MPSRTFRFRGMESSTLRKHVQKCYFNRQPTIPVPILPLRGLYIRTTLHKTYHNPRTGNRSQFLEIPRGPSGILSARERSQDIHGHAHSPRTSQTFSMFPRSGRPCQPWVGLYPLSNNTSALKHGRLTFVTQVRIKDIYTNEIFMCNSIVSFRAIFDSESELFLILGSHCIKYGLKGGGVCNAILV